MPRDWTAEELTDSILDLLDNPPERTYRPEPEPEPAWTTRETLQSARASLQLARQALDVQIKQLTKLIDQLDD